MTQTFAEGKRVPLTVLTVGRHVVLGNKTQEKDGYTAQILGVDSRKKTANKPLANFLKKVGLDFTPKNIREVRTEETAEAKSEINLAEVLTVGSTVSVTSVSKGKGTAGVMKRYGFHGGPRTHGQSDRARAPGSIGRGTTPGRVLKGKKMAGHMGSENIYISNLTIHSFDAATGKLAVTGPLPGSRGTLVRLTVTKKA
ncbi:MAG: 50S ribosomal protein L3 [Candidatus Collierbacteria bacterium GW2011_GWA1_44_12]|uniref:50S ribosomal protein L3 n=1 Tax=Candidatus Collierbacteria bacterium GW2011_GWA1_44_12 TaxID=1618376 RepID=A0A0G1GMT2_9BACT|nr:MAG: 50S ribosomal protein L3 [Candidatus Collierbacteria bacterium GW2011_GWA1_44_12]